MSQLARHIEEYLALRRALGFKLGKEAGSCRTSPRSPKRPGQQRSPLTWPSGGPPSRRAPARCGRRSG